ncbi:MAG: hypothetical protein EON58_01240 [Alphaproteobacteria bacterium]|nr:MAG: hypothetical protein EON58_01240 [Alphaproteobacteria bacterium]
MTDQDTTEYQAYIKRRTRELLKGKITSLPGLGCGSEGPDPIYGPMSEALNRAYVQGWINSEIDFIGMLSMLSTMGEDPRAIQELWDIAHKSPKSEDAYLYRRDWFERDYAHEQLQKAGIDPWGKRPKPPATSQLRAAKKKQTKAKKTTKTKR